MKVNGTAFRCAMFLLMAFLCGCRHGGFSPQADDIVFSEINFRIDSSEEVNAKFRANLFKLAISRQIRKGPIGLGGEVYGSNNYQIAIEGSCVGAIDDVAYLIRESSSGLGDEEKFLSSYKKSAMCITKKKKL